MAYTGDVTVGGAPDARELPGLTVTKVAVGPMDNDAYLLRLPPDRGPPVLIDAANEAATGCWSSSVTSTGQLDRHHPPALGSLAGAPRGGRGDRRGGHRPPRRRGRAPGPGHQPGPGRRPGGGRRDPSISVIHLRGHTPGSIALCYDADGALADSPHLFTGDSLFPGGPGNTEGDPKRFGQLIDDLEERVFGVATGWRLGVSGPRQGHHAGHRAPARSGVARPGMVPGAGRGDGAAAGAC